MRIYFFVKHTTKRKFIYSPQDRFDGQNAEIFILKKCTEIAQKGSDVKKLKLGELCLHVLTMYNIVNIL